MAAFFTAFFPPSGAALQDSNAAFEVSSVKASSPGASQGGIRRLDIETVSLAAMTLKEVVALCFHLRPYEIIGGPDWAGRQRFDIVGKDASISIGTASKLDRDAWSAAMDANDAKLRGLLRDRFALQFHRETRAMPGFALVKASRAKFVPVPCSATYRLQKGWVDGEIHMASLAALLKTELSAPVENKTRLVGCYHLQAQWTTDPSDTSLPGIPTALHDLGLRIEKVKADVSVLVIDRVELPRPD
jgi:uncharacterized protein (TIGR03435 family)